MRAEQTDLEARLGYRFQNPDILRRALTHSSLANETRTELGEQIADNERLEFLGDSVLGFLVAEALVLRFPEYSEGDLSRLKAHLVSAVHLQGAARRLEIGSHLALGRSEEMSGGRAKRTLMVDALEAVIAAVYLDGGLEAARSLIYDWVLAGPSGLDLEADGDADAELAITNFKSALQELVQARKLPQPRYTIVRERGPEHSKLFTVEVKVGKELSGQADGRTKKVAAQRAARAVYERLLEPNPLETVSSSAPPASA
jgi:ribonuclease III